MERHATISPPPTTDAVVPVQRTPDDGYKKVGVSAFCGWLAGTLFGTALAGAAMMTVLTPPAVPDPGQAGRHSWQPPELAWPLL
ncbi:hypothetical protein [Streptomyces sp. NPDC101776]|uniref:hypothetical protein n=1 Tax=Streptomyces sp. NPDC101776 TaxID=3366146 RepID=UPI0037F7F5D9